MSSMRRLYCVADLAGIADDVVIPPYSQADAAQVFILGTLHVEGVSGDTPGAALERDAFGEDEPEIAVWWQFDLEKLERGRGGHGAEVLLGGMGAKGTLGWGASSLRELTSGRT